MKIDNKEEFDKINIFGTGEFNKDYDEFFSGKSYLNPLTGLDESPVFLANVSCGRFVARIVQGKIHQPTNPNEP